MTGTSGSAVVVSVLMLAYEHGPYMAQAIEGVLAQEFDESFELLIGEDCSADESLRIALDFQRRHPHRITVVSGPRNVGMNENLSRLLSLARGEFIAFCEADDLWCSTDKLRIQVDLMRRRPDCSLVHSNFLHLVMMRDCWRTRLAHRNARALGLRRGSLYATMLQSNRVQTCTVLTRRALMLEFEHSFPQRGSYRVADWPLFLFLARQGTFEYIDSPLACYRRVAGSATNSGFAADVLRCEDAIRMVGDFCNYFRDGPDVARPALIAQHRTLLWLAFLARDRNAFARASEWLREHAPRGLEPATLLMLGLIGSRRLHACFMALLRVAREASLRMTSVAADAGHPS